MVLVILQHAYTSGITKFSGYLHAYYSLKFMKTIS